MRDSLNTLQREYLARRLFCEKWLRVAESEKNIQAQKEWKEKLEKANQALKSVTFLT